MPPVLLDEGWVVLAEWDPARHPRGPHGWWARTFKEAELPAYLFPRDAPLDERIPPETKTSLKSRLGWDDEKLTWARTLWGFTSDGNPSTMALQKAAEYEFDVDDAFWSPDDFRHGPPDPATTAQLAPYVQAIYDNTQAELRKAGIGPDDMVTLYRGMSFKSETETPEYLKGQGQTHVKVKQRPLTAWTTKRGVAGSYSAMEDYGYEQIVLTTQVPAKRIFSVAGTGMGNPNPSEVILIGGDIEADALISHPLSEKDYIESWTHR